MALKLCTNFDWTLGKCRDEDPTFFSTDPDPTQLEKKPDPDPDPRPEIEMKKKYICVLGR